MKKNKDRNRLIVWFDSGHSEFIVFAPPKRHRRSPERKRHISLPDKMFGRTINSEGFSGVNLKVGMIYGDSMYQELYKKTIATMKEIDCAASNLVGKILYFTTIEEVSPIGIITSVKAISEYSTDVECYIFADNKISPIWFNTHELKNLSTNGFTVCDKTKMWSVE